MKNIKLAMLTSALIGLSCSSAFAQSKVNAWEGAYGQIGIGYEIYSPSSATGTVNAYGMTFPNSSSGQNATGPTGKFSLGYNFGLNSSYVVGIEASMYPGHSQSAATTSTTTTPLGSTTINGTYRAANVWVVSFIPGFVIDKDRLAYLKLGYSGGTIESSSAIFSQQNISVGGFATGLGYKQMFSDSFYGYGEVNYAAFSPKSVTIATDVGTINSTTKGTGTDFILGVGYRF
jgi:outer membrane immunogenic protein